MSPHPFLSQVCLYLSTHQFRLKTRTRALFSRHSIASWGKKGGASDSFWGVKRRSRAPHLLFLKVIASLSLLLRPKTLQNSEDKMRKSISSSHGLLEHRVDREKMVCGDSLVQDLALLVAARERKFITSSDAFIPLHDKYIDTSNAFSYTNNSGTGTGPYCSRSGGTSSHASKRLLKFLVQSLQKTLFL